VTISFSNNILGSNTREFS